ncbi:MAG: flagellar protein FliS [Myxococcota bacterium]|jgi:flagellar protein FliS
MNPLDTYRKTRILTASPGELLVMLYDGLLQRVRIAAKKMDAGDPAKAGELLGRAQDILHELMNMLARDQAPELADNLMALYGYCSRLLIGAVAEQDTEKLNEVYELLKPLRDAWHEAEQTVRTDRQSAAVG